MNDELRELGRRAIAAGFVWVPGARTTSGQRVVCVRPNESPIACYEDNGYTIHLAGGQTPDFSDPATLGCLLAQVRELWEDRGLSVCGIYEAGVWVWMFNEGKPHGASFYRARSVRQPSEAAALVAALEAAPKAAP